MRGETAALALLTAVTVYEVDCLRRGDHDALLSRVVDRLRARHPIVDVATRTVIVATAAHLCRLVPGSLDVYRVCS